MENGSGFTIRSWRDVLTLGMILSLAGSVFAWLWKLDFREAALGESVSEIKGQVAVGILPRTDERLQAHEREMQALQRQIDDLKRGNGK